MDQKPPKFPTSGAILDDDVSFLKTLELYTKKIGFHRVNSFMTGEAIWTDLKDKEYDILFLDWKLPGKVSGLNLFNRIRRHSQFSMTPILVVSGFLKNNDFRLLAEFPCTDLLEKPFQFKKFQEKVTKIWDEYRWYAANLESIKSIFDQSKKDVPEAIKNFKTLIGGSPNPAKITLIVGKLLEEHNHLNEAESLYQSILVKNPKDVAAMSNLGRIFHLKGEHAKALRILGAANSLSPHNMERLCLTGKIELSEVGPEKARETFTKALEIDEEDTIAHSGIVLADNATTFFQSINQTISPTKNFASLMNSIAIAQIKAGNLKEGIKHYHASLSFISNKTDRARVMFNVGLGHIRKNQPVDAFNWFKKSSAVEGSNFSKSNEYIEKLKSNEEVAMLLKKAEEAAKSEKPAEKLPVETKKPALSEQLDLSKQESSPESNEEKELFDAKLEDLDAKEDLEEFNEEPLNKSS